MNRKPRRSLMFVLREFLALLITSLPIRKLLER